MSQKPEAALTGALPLKVTPPAPHFSTVSHRATQPRLSHLASTQAKPWTPLRPAVPLTAALTALSFSLPESEFSADGDEAEQTPALTFTTPGKKTLGSPVQRTTSIQQRAGSGTTADKYVTSCADRPCFPGVQCEPAVDGWGYRCGRCPVGYTGDGRFCQGRSCVKNAAFCLTSRVHTLQDFIPMRLCLQLFADTLVAETWSVLHPTRAAANQGTPEPTVRRVKQLLHD